MVETRLKGRAYEFIRQGLMEGRWSGDQLVSTVRLASDIGTSLIPVREAIVQLEAEGLIEKVENRGIRAKQLIRKELQEMFYVRSALECKAVELATRHITSDELDELEDNCRQMREVLLCIREHLKQDAEAVRQGDFWVGPLAEKNFYLNIVFHTLILRASRNSRLIKTVGNLHVLSQSLRNFYVVPPLMNSLSQITRDYGLHVRIYRALRRKDAVWAVSYMSRHVEDSQRYHLAAYDYLEQQKRIQTRPMQPQYSRKIIHWLENMENDEKKE